MPTKISWTDWLKCFFRHRWHRIHDDDCDFENSHLCLRCGAGKVALKKYKLVFVAKWLTFGLGFDYILDYRELVIKVGPLYLGITRRYEQ